MPAETAALLDDAPSGASVLIVDQSPENREVLRFALARRGVEILEADETNQGLELLQLRRPRVVVLDLEGETDEAQATFDQFDAATERHCGRLVVLGKLHSFDGSEGVASGFAKPYHFAPLILKIEELLARS
jgi:response regulator RpfG family c-di-GMP phosphodiesterase